MKKRKFHIPYSLKELIRINKEDIKNDSDSISKIEKKIEERHIKNDYR